MSLEHVVALPQDFVITEGQIGNTMYFIEAGEVRLAHPQLPYHTCPSLLAAGRI